jgi:phage tail protein X
MDRQNLHTNTLAKPTCKATHEVSEPTYEHIAKTNIQSHTGIVKSYIRPPWQNQHTKPHMNCQNLHTESFTSQTYKATHGLSELVQEVFELTYRKPYKTNIHNHIGPLKTYIQKAVQRHCPNLHTESLTEHTYKATHGPARTYIRKA